uniref:hypothetical protein n=1 Tax=Staphylococcus aureus TaxID=1280 RepID=UPI00210B9BAA
ICSSNGFVVELFDAVVVDVETLFFIIAVHNCLAVAVNGNSFCFACRYCVFSCLALFSAEVMLSSFVSWWL